ncbi:alpha/beta fold hydrolase [Dyella silvatica]|uniref:alpha/beta fold hydrolase n=1 Tax=Dyella silvatica TaxID=2992128 RepID=UPI00224E1085|nr:alpha/beta hydrolase [Dyella silvatica]
MRYLSGLLFTCAMACAPLADLRAADADLKNANDVYNQLQHNAWYLKTADHVADLYVTELGVGTPVVFLHGGPGNDFQYIIDALRPQLGEHRFILFDQRGSLLSPVPEQEVSKLTMGQLVDDLETLRKALGVEKLVLFGHSFGTVLAMSYYQAHPEHVAGLVLAASVPPTFGPGGLAAWLKVMRPRQHVLMGRAEAIAAAEKAASLPTDPKSDTAQQKSTRWRIEKQASLNIIDLSRWRDITGGGVYYNEKVSEAIGNTLPSDFDVRPTLKAHPVPITVIQGDHDYIDPAGQSWLSDVKAGLAQVNVVPSASHYSWIDDPSGFAIALRKGLSRADVGR